METLEDVLAGPETEVMDAIQVAANTFSLTACVIFGGNLCHVFLSFFRRELTDTIFELPQVPNGSKSGRFCPQTSPSQVQLVYVRSYTYVR